MKNKNKPHGTPETAPRVVSSALFGNPVWEATLTHEVYGDREIIRIERPVPRRLRLTQSNRESQEQCSREIQSLDRPDEVR